MSYILIVILHVNSGSTISMQEFDNQVACKRAVSHIIAEAIRANTGELK